MKKVISITIDPTILEKFRIYCFNRKMKISKVISDLIEKEMEFKIEVIEDGSYCR